MKGFYAEEGAMWFPQWTVADWEDRHSPFLDHVDLALKEAGDRAEERFLNARGTR